MKYPLVYSINLVIISVVMAGCVQSNTSVNTQGNLQNNTNKNNVAITANVNNNVNNNLNSTVDTNTNTVSTNTTEITSGQLTVDWHSELINRNAADYGFQIPADDYSYGSRNLDDFFTVFEVGTISSEPFLGQPLLLIARTCDGPCGDSHYRVIDNRGNDGGLVFLRKLSSEMYEEDAAYFTISDEFDIPDLRYPSELAIDHNGTTLQFSAEEFTPAVLFDYFVNGHPDYRLPEPRELKSELTDPLYGTFYEAVSDGFFFFELPDHTIKLYRLEFPVWLREDSTEYGALLEVASVWLQLSDGTQHEGDYSPVDWVVCPPREYQVFHDIADQLQPLGTVLGNDGSTVQVYETKDINDPLQRDVFAAQYDRDQTYEEFTASLPVIFMQDTLGRWLRFVDIEYYPAVEAGCGYQNSVL